MKNAKTGYDYNDADTAMLRELLVHCERIAASNEPDAAEKRAEVPKIRAVLAVKEKWKVRISANVGVKGHDLSVSLSGHLSAEGSFSGSGLILRDGEKVRDVSWDGEDFSEGGLLLPGSTDDTIDVYAALAAAVRGKVREARGL